MLFTPDPVRSFGVMLDGKELRLDNMIKWCKPSSVTGFKIFISLYKQSINKHKGFITTEDHVLLELMNSIDPELLMENEDFMKKFEMTYRFFRNLT